MTDDEYRYPITLCWHCDQPLDAASNMPGQEGGPFVGAISLCMYCGAVGIFGPDLKLFPPTKKELEDLEKDKEFLEKISPSNNAHLITSPLFIIHGTNDPRVPIGEAEQIERTLKKLGREVHLMKFDDEGHGLIKLKNRISGYTAALEFLMSHLSG